MKNTFLETKKMLITMSMEEYKKVVKLLNITIEKITQGYLRRIADNK